MVYSQCVELIERFRLELTMAVLVRHAGQWHKWEARRSRSLTVRRELR